MLYPYKQTHGSFSSQSRAVMILPTHPPRCQYRLSILAFPLCFMRLSWSPSYAVIILICHSDKSIAGTLTPLQTCPYGKRSPNPVILQGGCSSTRSPVDQVPNSPYLVLIGPPLLAVVIAELVAWADKIIASCNWTRRLWNIIVLFQTLGTIRPIGCVCCCSDGRFKTTSFDVVSLYLSE